MDEVGERSETSDFRHEKVKAVLDLREGSLAAEFGFAPTIVISNRSLEQLRDIYGDPYVSRLAAGTVVVFPAEDRRLTEKGPDDDRQAG